MRSTTTVVLLVNVSVRFGETKLADFKKLSAGIFAIAADKSAQVASAAPTGIKVDLQST